MIQTFSNVSLLITHYNRSKSLEKLLLALQDLNLQFAEVVVSDDASDIDHRARLDQLQNNFKFRLLSAPMNRGLGNNLNKGQLAVNSPYTLYIQEDFIPLTNFPQALKEALSILELDQTIDLAGFYSYSKYPYLIPYSKNYSTKVYRPWYTKTSKIYQYSDHPHLRRSSFLEKFGNYKEGIKSDKTEYKMCISFLRKKGKAVIHHDFRSLLKQENSAQEPSTVSRADWRQSKNPFISLIRIVYRQIKYNYDIHLSTK